MSRFHLFIETVLAQTLTRSFCYTAILGLIISGTALLTPQTVYGAIVDLQWSRHSSSSITIYLPVESDDGQGGGSLETIENGVGAFLCSWGSGSLGGGLYYGNLISYCLTNNTANYNHTTRTIYVPNVYAFMSNTGSTTVVASSSNNNTPNTYNLTISQVEGQIIGSNDASTTRIVSVFPPDNPTRATSSAWLATTTFPLSTTVYVAPEDFATGMKLEMSYMLNANSQSTIASFSIAGVAPNSAKFTFDIEHAGYSTFSTTSAITATGTYTFTNKIKVPAYALSSFADTVVSWFNWAYSVDVANDTTINKVTSFIINDWNGWDSFSADPTQTGLDPSTDCQLATLDIPKCLLAIFIPDQATLGAIAQQYADDLLSRFPLGYVTRFLAILATASPQIPPPIEYTFGTSTTQALRGQTITFQMWDKFTLVTDIRSDDGQNKNIWDITMPYFNGVTALAILAFIIVDLFGISFSASNDSNLPSDRITQKQRRRMTLKMDKRDAYAKRVGIKDLDMRNN